MCVAATEIPTPLGWASASCVRSRCLLWKKCTSSGIPARGSCKGSLFRLAYGVRSLVLIFTIIAAYLLLRGIPEGWHIILRVCFAVFVLVFGLAIWGKRPPAKSTVATPERTPRWLDFLSMGLAILVIEALFLLFFASAPGAAEDLARNLDKKLHPATYRTPSDEEEDLGSGAPLKTSGNWLWQNNGRRELGGSGKVSPSNRPEVYLWPDDARLFSQSELYLRSFTLSRYRNGVWEAEPEPPQSLDSRDGKITIAPDAERSLAYEVYHGPNTRGQSLAVTLPGLIEIASPSLRRIAPATYRLPPLAEDAEAYRYRARSAPTFFRSGMRPAPLTSPTLPLAPEARAAIQEIVRATSGSPGDRLNQVRTLLANRCQYSLDPGLDERADPLVEFLETKRRGFCEHFATASALIARELGYPSRVAYGWSGGRFYEAPNMFVFRAKEAHAWTEVQVASGEWVIFEATPPDRSEGNASIAQANEPPPIPSGFDPGIGLGLSHLSSPSLALPSLAPLKRFALLIGGFAALAFLISLFIKRPEKENHSGRPGSGLLPRPQNYLTTFRRASTALGFPMPPGRTLRQHLSELRSQNQAPEFADELLRYHYEVTYGFEPRTKTTEKRFQSLSKKWRRKN